MNPFNCINDSFNEVIITSNYRGCKGLSIDKLENSYIFRFQMMYYLWSYSCISSFYGTIKLVISVNEKVRPRTRDANNKRLAVNVDCVIMICDSTTKRFIAYFLVFSIIYSADHLLYGENHFYSRHIVISKKYGEILHDRIS